MDGCLQRHLSPQILPHLNQFYKGRLEIQGVPSYHQEAQFHAGKSMRTQAAINKKRQNQNKFMFMWLRTWQQTSQHASEQQIKELNKCKMF